VVLSNLLADDRDETIINEESLSWRDNLGNILVVNPETLSCALLFERVISGDLDG